MLYSLHRETTWKKSRTERGSFFFFLSSLKDGYSYNCKMSSHRNDLVSTLKYFSPNSYFSTKLFKSVFSQIHTVWWEGCWLQPSHCHFEAEVEEKYVSCQAPAPVLATAWPRATPPLLLPPPPPALEWEIAIWACTETAKKHLDAL